MKSFKTSYQLPLVFTDNWTIVSVRAGFKSWWDKTESRVIWFGQEADSTNATAPVALSQQWMDTRQHTHCTHCKQWKATPHRGEVLHHHANSFLGEFVRHLTSQNLAVTDWNDVLRPPHTRNITACCQSADRMLLHVKSYQSPEMSRGEEVWGEMEKSRPEWERKRQMPNMSILF